MENLLFLGVPILKHISNLPIILVSDRQNYIHTVKPYSFPEKGKYIVMYLY